MGIGPDQCIGIGNRFAVNCIRDNQLGKIFQIHLMDNADGGRDHPKLIKSLLPPFQEFISFLIPFKFPLGVNLQRICRSISVHLNGVIDDQIYRDKRLNNLWIAAEFLHRRSHRRQINEKGDTCEILCKHAGWLKRDFNRFGLFRIPVCQVHDVLLCNLLIIVVSQ